MSKNNIILQKGVAWYIRKGVRVAVQTVGDMLQKYYSCCGPDCCENIYRWIDKDTGTTYVKYVFAGAEVFETETAYKAKVANGDFTY